MSVEVVVEKHGGPSTQQLYGIIDLTRQQSQRWDGDWRIVVSPPARAIGVGLQTQRWLYCHSPRHGALIELWELGRDAGTYNETLVLELYGFDLATFTTGQTHIHTGSGRLLFSDHGDFRGAVRWNTRVSSGPVPGP